MLNDRPKGAGPFRILCAYYRIKGMPNLQVAFLDRYHPNICDTIRRGLPSDWAPHFAESRELKDQTSAVIDAELLFVMAAPVTPEILSAANKLRFIQKLGAGVDRIDLKVCAERGIAVARLAGGNAIPVAEHTLLLILATLRRLPSIDRRTRAGEWLKEESRGINRQLHGKRVGLVGLGAIGKELAKLLKGFEVDIVYYDPVPPSAETEQKLGVHRAGLDELLETSDVVSLHLPLMPATANLISKEKIARMKLGAVLINSARGGLVDEAALAAALSEGRLFGAGIDAFAKEPPGRSPLFALDQTVVTPHFAGATIDNFSSVIERAAQNARQYLNDGTLPASDAVFLPQPHATVNTQS
jgi:D-3-phosphoglycerate dehydrogenase / 2-oxoglutarate reductase